MGYALEGLAASLIVVLFLGGALYTNQGPGYDWSGYTLQLESSDISYVSAARSDVQNLVRNAAPESIARLQELYSGDKLSTSVHPVDFGGGTATVGVYVPPGDRMETTLQNVNAGPPASKPCQGRLGELDSEFNIKKTREPSGTGINELHDTKIYVTDEDPQLGSGFNGNQDYDTIYVDNGTECAFSRAEGPIREGELFLWGDMTNSANASYYSFRAADSNTLEVYRSNPAGELRRRTRRAELAAPELEYRTFNMSEELDEDLLVFNGNSTTVNTVNVNANKLMDYLRGGKMLLAAPIEEPDLQVGLLDQTGLRWVDLTRTAGSGSFTDFPHSSATEAYFNSTGCYSCGSLDLDPDGKVTSSPGESYVSERGGLMVSTGSYDGPGWDVSDSGLSSTGSGGEGVPNSSCSAPSHWFGFLDFPNTTDTEPFQVVVTELGIGGAGCSGDYAVNIDLNGDVDFSDPGEGPAAEGEELTVNGRTYEVSAGAGSVTFDYVGSESVELVNYVESFPGSEAGGLARMENLSEGGELGGNQGEQLVTASAVILKMLDGSSSGTGATAPETVAGQLDGLPYSFRQGWER